jgi:hypothetical protein
VQSECLLYPKSGHVRCNWVFPLRARSGHSRDKFEAPEMSGALFLSEGLAPRLSIRSARTRHDADTDIHNTRVGMDTQTRSTRVGMDRHRSKRVDMGRRSGMPDSRSHRRTGRSHRSKDHRSSRNNPRNKGPWLPARDQFQLQGRLRLHPSPNRRRATHHATRRRANRPTARRQLLVQRLSLRRG